MPTMNDANQNRLLDLKARQESGEHLPCPRCGRDTMNPTLYRNALSRAFDIQICDECGIAESLLAFVGKSLSTDDWACMKED